MGLVFPLKRIRPRISQDRVPARGVCARCVSAHAPGLPSLLEAFPESPQATTPKAGKLPDSPVFIHRAPSLSCATAGAQTDTQQKGQIKRKPQSHRQLYSRVPSTLFPLLTMPTHPLTSPPPGAGVTSGCWGLLLEGPRPGRQTGVRFSRRRPDSPPW